MIQLKIWCKSFEAILDGTKTFEVRENDHDYQIHDILLLREYSPIELKYSGRECMVQITYIQTEFGLPDGIVCMSVKKL